MADHEMPGEIEMDARLREEGAAHRSARAGCPAPDLLVARATSLLDAELLSTLDRHVASCDACRRLALDFEQLDLATAASASAERVRARVFKTPARRWFLFPLAAAMVMATAVGVLLRVRTPPSPAGDAVAVTNASTTDAPAPVTALWTVAPAPVRVPLSTLGPQRGGPAALESAGLLDALAPYQAGDYAASIRRLSDWVRTSPSSGEGYFYLGVSQLLAGDSQAAVASLAAASERVPPSRRREVEWYRAAAEQRSGDVGASRVRLRSLCAEAGAYHAEACAAETVLR